MILVRHFRAPTLSALAGAVALSVASTALATGAHAASSEGSGDGEYSLFGSYLAGRHAIAQRDRKSAAEFLNEALSLDPDNRMLLERTITYKLSSGKLDQALALAPRVLEAAPTNLGANIVSGLAAFRSGDMATARSFFSENDSGPIAQLAVGLLTMWTYEGEGRPKKAVKTLEKIGDGSAFEAFRMYHTALLAEVQGDLQTTQAAYEKAYEAAQALRTVDAFGRFLERTDQHDRAIRIYKAFLEGSPTHPIVTHALKRAEARAPVEPLIANAREGVAETLYSIGSALTQDGGGDLALIYLNFALYMKPNMSISHFLMADIHDRQRRYEEAINNYSAIESFSPLKREAEIQAALNLDSLDRTDEAKERLDNLIRINPADSVALSSAGTMMRARQRFEEAEPYYAKAIALIDQPTQNDWRLYYFRGITYERTDRWSQAEADFKKALELHPDQPLVLNYLGYSWIDLGMNLDVALDMVRKAVEQRPNDGYIVDSLGWAYYRLGDFERAVEELERAVELRPDDPVINDHLGDALWQVGRRTEAQFQWNHALAMEPEEDEIPKIREKLANGLPADGEPTDSVAVKSEEGTSTTTAE